MNLSESGAFMVNCEHSTGRMAIDKILIDQFIQMSEKYPVFDVRSPAEFAHAHIPGAYSLPLFSDEERKVVGTTYKQQSREAAIKTGLDFFGPRMRRVVEEVEAVCKQFPYPDKAARPQVLVHCWRGGMRSAAIAWLLDLYGWKVTTLAGGYKQYRNFVLKMFEYPFAFNILGGYTGSGKTDVLRELKHNGAPVIDLERIAHHKGSAFGAINEPPQPSQEMFENKLANALYFSFRPAFFSNENNEADGNSLSVWLEDESQRIGSVNIPQALWNTMRSAPVYFLDIPFEKRLDHLVAGYGNLDKEPMLHAIVRIKKRLGGLETKTAVNFLIEDNIRECFRVLLTYYDKQYQKGLMNRDRYEHLVTRLDASNADAAINARKLQLLLQHSAQTIST